MTVKVERIEWDPKKCPFCGSVNIEKDSMAFVGSLEVWIALSCFDCREVIQLPKDQTKVSIIVDDSTLQESLEEDPHYP